MKHVIPEETKTFTAFMETEFFITVFKTARHLPLS